MEDYNSLKSLINITTYINRLLERDRECMGIKGKQYLFALMSTESIPIVSSMKKYTIKVFVATKERQFTLREYTGDFGIKDYDAIDKWIDEAIFFVLGLINGNTYRLIREDKYGVE